MDAVCFTCGAPAASIVRLSSGCSIYPVKFPMFVGLCPQHACSIEPLDEMKTIAKLERADG